MFRKLNVLSARLPSQELETYFLVRLYDLRHRFCSDLLNAGASVGAVAKAFGHARTSTTLDHYYEVLPEDVAAITRLLPKLDVTRAKVEAE